MENVLCDMAVPMMLDLKMGTRTYGDDASPGKQVSRARGGLLAGFCFTTRCPMGEGGGANPPFPLGPGFHGGEKMKFYKRKYCFGGFWYTNVWIFGFQDPPPPPQPLRRTLTAGAAGLGGGGFHVFPTLRSLVPAGVRGGGGAHQQR